MMGRIVREPGDRRAQLYVVPVRAPGEDGEARETVRMERFLDARAAAIRASEP